MNKTETKKRDSCTFVETNHQKGIIDQLRELAIKDGRSLSNYIGIIITNHIKNNK
tara:strand:- start:522 stop:686 length:165 start_codon:yes stop_codon:yes gene_type:complete